MPGTRLRVFNGSFGDTAEVDQGRLRKVDIKVGECLIFRGDVAHCGLSYETTNYWIHCNWNRRHRHHREPNLPRANQIVRLQAWLEIWNHSALRRHLRWCLKFGDPKQVKATHKRYNELNRPDEKVQPS